MLRAASVDSGGGGIQIRETGTSYINYRIPFWNLLHSGCRAWAGTELRRNFGLSTNVLYPELHDFLYATVVTPGQTSNGRTSKSTHTF